MNKIGELASPSATQPLLVLGDVSALRVRAEVDERDIEEIKIGQSVLVRPIAFHEREFAGTVSFIARLVEPGRNRVRGQRDVGVVEVLVDLPEPGPLSVGMKAECISVGIALRALEVLVVSMSACRVPSAASEAANRYGISASQQSGRHLRRVRCLEAPPNTARQRGLREWRFRTMQAVI
jgi:hypothetical protein